MRKLDVRIADSGDKEMLTDIITAGFIADPITRWVWPDLHTYLAMMPEFISAFGGRAFDHDSAYLMPDGNAAALWLPPGIEPDAEAILSLFQTSVSGDKLAEVEDFFEQMDAYHPADQACWYLPMIATEPASTGMGLGSAILAHALRRCDHDGTITYLESSNPRNIPLYERFGFETIGVIQAGSSPPMYPMIRPARPTA